MRFLIFLLIVQQAYSLNILLTSRDSWVSKDTRMLYSALKAEKHNVVMVAPLYNNVHQSDYSKREENTVNDGGDFGHLLSVHQTYFRNLKKLMSLPKGAKNVISRRDEIDFDTKYDSEKLIKNDSYGQDPLDESIWYVNSPAVKSLLVAYDLILPKYYPDFKPDLVIMGPNQGLSLTPNDYDINSMFSDDDNCLQSMIKLSQIKNHPVIAVSTEDNHHIYFQDEQVFNIQQESLSKTLKKNVFGTNVQFVNHKIIELINSFSTIPANLALNVNFPSINHQHSHCFTKNINSKASRSNPFFEVIDYEILPDTNNTVILPKLAFEDNGIIVTGNYEVKLVEDEPTYVDKRSYYYQQTLKNYQPPTISDNDDINELYHNNKPEWDAINSCKITVSSLSNLGIDLKKHF